MKSLLLVCLLSTTLFFNVKSQSVNGVPLKDIESEYIEIVGTRKLMGNQVTIEINFGQQDKIFKTKDTQLLDEEGKLLRLNSMIDALNFLSSHGYEFVDAYAIGAGGQYIYHYIMKRED